MTRAQSLLAEIESITPRRFQPRDTMAQEHIARMSRAKLRMGVALDNMAGVLEGLADDTANAVGVVKDAAVDSTGGLKQIVDEALAVRDIFGVSGGNGGPRVDPTEGNTPSTGSVASSPNSADTIRQSQGNSGHFIAPGSTS